MKHYATLRNFEVESSTLSLRGAMLYGNDHAPLALIDDVVIEHEAGVIDYLVADMGHGRKVLLPRERVSQSRRDERAFISDLTVQDLQRLPMFQEKMLDPKLWGSYKELHDASLPSTSSRNADSNDRNPRAGNVTSIDVGRGRVQQKNIGINATGFFPQRMTTIDPAPSGCMLTMVAAGSRADGENAAHAADVMRVRWMEFQDSLRENLDDIREQCRLCKAQRRRIA